VSAAVAGLVAAGPPSPEAIDAFLASREFPIVEGRSVTFVYRGPGDDIRLRHWIFGLPSSRPFHRVEGTDLWTLEVDLPERSRVEYKIEKVVDGRTEWIMDPLNPRQARDPFGANSVCHGAGYETPDWTLPDPEARSGEIRETRIDSRALGGARTVLVYLPARFRLRRRYPLLVVHDGGDYLRYASFVTVLDNLIHRLEVPPLVAALIQSPDRLREYADDRRHALVLVAGAGVGDLVQVVDEERCTILRVGGHERP